MGSKQKHYFDDNFMWGASVSAHQVEGGNHNDWTVWELQNATTLAKNSATKYSWLPIWPDIKSQAQDPGNYVSGQATDHYRRYKEDFDLVKSLNLNSFRFGVEWSRIEPEPGKFDQKEIEHYKKYIAELKARGVKPVINLWHWTLPVWFAEIGGFENPRNIAFFLRFVEKIAEDLIIPCGFVITLNEPNTYAANAYSAGIYPPGKHSPIISTLVLSNLARTHKRVYRLLKSMDPALQIGVATQLRNDLPRRPDHYFDIAVSKTSGYLWNWWFLSRIKKYQDFVGFNYYFTDYFKGFHEDYPKKFIGFGRGKRGAKFNRSHNPKVPVSDLGWYMEPSGIQKVILETQKRYGKPIIITENGVADSNDQYRQWWLEETINSINRANKLGGNVVGYFHWSLLDNFEWSDGWWPKFGLIEVDRTTMERKIRLSAKWLSNFLEKLNQNA